MAGIPSISKCIGCHSNLSIESETITTLNKHWEKATPIEWVRVYDLPDHVWFSHKRHVAKEIGCQVCHGAVETLEVNARLVTYKMGFCLNCHQEKEAPTDCWTCHI
jgi:c(7)-type cytochrome triheme protein